MPVMYNIVLSTVLMPILMNWNLSKHPFNGNLYLQLSRQVFFMGLFNAYSFVYEKEDGRKSSFNRCTCACYPSMLECFKSEPLHFVFYAKYAFDLILTIGQAYVLWRGWREMEKQTKLSTP
ncbi:uncharacterized protein BYT42DRAFT_151235 [Radiomyces spectabilis]|uniref:uncharacterized protein n=1 Tax=Radiomyces spectabilis TaxID=64574 RepID=UPI00221FC62A|nr:uncharacterized protein BYT42DRAFT_151235 [Radiomyces spectabilis]KAI8366028.1 hypothetical protein BYT42DRAFT_151235 [Radiomyces spectabilis]